MKTLIATFILTLTLSNFAFAGLGMSDDCGASIPEITKNSSNTNNSETIEIDGENGGTI